MADKFMLFESFLRKYQMGKFVSLDLSGLKNVVKKMRDAFHSVTGQQGKLMKTIRAGSEAAMYAVTYKIYTEYRRRLKGSKNPIAKQVLDVLGGVCSEMQNNSSKYFNIKPEGKDSIMVRARPFNMQVYNTQTMKIRQMYYRPAGVVKAKNRDIKIQSIFAENPLYGSKSGHLGMGVIFEFGRTSSGTIRPGQEKKKKYFSVVDNNAILKQKKSGKNKGELTLGNQRSALLIPVPGSSNEYVFRKRSKWKKAKGMHLIYEENNILRQMYKDLFAKTLSNYLRASGFDIRVSLA